ncbi:MAG: HEAT repeat domain-containing protein [Treponema sp.]|jgi:HEAT repeat protein|nr:HEAT repeat domain-containing protein [Treponema sp.]
MTIERWRIFLFFFIASITLKISADEEWQEIVKFGTEAEITILIQKLKTDASYSGELDSEFVNLARNTKNQKILVGVLSFFGNKAKDGLEDKALSILENRENETPEAVSAAVEYFGKIKGREAVSVLKDVIDNGLPDFRGQSIRAIGKAADKDNADDIAAYLIDLYENRDPGPGNNGVLIEALGEIGSKNAVSFLADIVKNAEDSSSLRIAAINALSKIGDGLDAIMTALSATEPSVRTAAAGALGTFSGSQVDDAIIENFRDSFFRVRAAAAKSAGQRKLASAVPYLKYRAEKDEALVVKEESIKALGQIGTADALNALETFFSESKNPDKIRILAAEMLLNNKPDAYVENIIVTMDDAQKKRQNTLYNGFLRVLSTAKSSKLEDLARRFFASGAASEKTCALDITLNNKFSSLKDQVAALTDKKNGSLAAKAEKVLANL